MPFKGFQIGNLLIDKPIIQGGMAVGISLSGLASAVANEGGVGVIAATGIGMDEPDFTTNPSEANRRALEREIKKAKSLTSGVIGVNLMMVANGCFELMEVSIRAGIDIVFMGAGLPVKIPKLIFDRSKRKLPKFVPIVSSTKAAQFILSYWEKEYRRIPDAFVIEGPLAGGHLGFKKEFLTKKPPELTDIVREIVAMLKPWEMKYECEILVIAGGGIFDGQDIKPILASGAKAVQMATRFVATDECDASHAFKQAYLNCEKDDIVLIDSPVGMAGRAIRGPYLDEVSRGVKKPFRCAWHCIKSCDMATAPYCIAAALMQAKYGRFTDGFAFCGANAFKINQLVSVKKLMRELELEFKKA